jgi:hypothetical protein
MVVDVEEAPPPTPLPLAAAVVVVAASFSPSSSAGSHLNLMWFLNATAAAWRSSTGASVEMNCVFLSVVEVERGRR